MEQSGTRIGRPRAVRVHAPDIVTPLYQQMSLRARPKIALLVSGGTLHDCFNNLTIAIRAFGGIAMTELAHDLWVLYEECSRLIRVFKTAEGRVT